MKTKFTLVLILVFSPMTVLLAQSLETIPILEMKSLQKNSEKTAMPMKVIPEDGLNVSYDFSSNFKESISYSSQNTYKEKESIINDNSLKENVMKSEEARAKRAEITKAVTKRLQEAAEMKAINANLNYTYTKHSYIKGERKKILLQNKVDIEKEKDLVQKTLKNQTQNVNPLVNSDGTLKQ